MGAISLIVLIVSFGAIITEFMWQFTDMIF